MMDEPEGGLTETPVERAAALWQLAHRLTSEPQGAVQYVSPPSEADRERKRVADLIRGLVGRQHCQACRLRWNAGNRRDCRRCRTSDALAYAIEADCIAEHMRRAGALSDQNGH